MDGVLRTFFAVELDAAARREARAVAERLAREPGGDCVLWVQPESYHVTLRFLGETPRERVAEIAAVARRATRGTAPFALRLAALAGFPSPRRPRSVVLQVEPREPLAALAGQLERAAVEGGFAPESRTFQPHLTLGRVRRHLGPAPLLDPAGGCDGASPFPVASVVLFQSVLAPGGARYEPLERIALGGTRSP